MNVYGIVGKEGGYPTRVFHVVAESGEQALQMLRTSGEAEGVELSDALELLTGMHNRPEGVWYAGPWPWPAG